MPLQKKTAKKSRNIGFRSRTRSTKRAKKKSSTSTVKRRRVYIPTFIERIMHGLLNRMKVHYVAQYPFRRMRGRYYYLDFALPDLQLAIECDGAAYHSSAAQKKRDAKRQLEIEEQGWEVIRFTGSQIVTDIKGCEQVLIDLIKGLTS